MPLLEHGSRRAAAVAFRGPLAQLLPMTIDHERRRADIAVITIDLIAREGLEAASIRRIAAEAGFSTSAITNYFADKQELLVWTFQVLSEEGERRFEEAQARNPAGVIDALLTMVPWCPANVRRWKAYLAFWDQAARDPELAQLITKSTNTGFLFLRHLFRSRAVPEASAAKSAQLLNAMIQGLALQMLVDQGNWTDAAIRTRLQDAWELALLETRKKPDT